MSKNLTANRMRYADIEEYRRSINRRLMFRESFAWLLSTICVLVTAFVLSKPAAVIAFDTEGRPMVFRDTLTPAIETNAIRVEAFVRDFLELFAGIDATELIDDYERSLKMMTPALGRVTQDKGVELQRRQKYAGTRIRSRFTPLHTRIADFRADADLIYAVAWGRQEFYLVGEAKPPVTRFIFVELEVQRVPVRITTPAGLLVARYTIDSFEDQAKMEAKKLELLGAHP